MVDEERLKEQKGEFFQRFYFSVKEISKGGEPRSFEDIIYYLEHALPFFPRDERGDLLTMINVAKKQLSYNQAKNDVKITGLGHEKRENKIYKFLQKYNGRNKKYSK